MKSAYPQTQNPVSIRLYANIPFDNTYEHHSLISEWFRYNGSKIYDKAGVTACESFIDRKKYALTPNPPFYYPRWDMTDTCNFDFQNGLVGSVTLELTPEQTNANYMRVTCGSDVYYYFITGIKQVNFETYTLTLELDVLMTYQDEFLEGVKDIPMMTDRKHCHRYTNDGLMPHSADLKTGDDVFAGVKPSLVKQVHKLHYENNDMKTLEGIIWLYVCVDLHNINDASSIDTLVYSCKGKNYPLVMMALPLNVNSLTYAKSDNSYSVTFNKAHLNQVIKDIVDDGSVHGAKLSPYPPFVIKSASASITLDSSRNLTIKSSYVTEIGSFGGSKLYQMDIGNNSFYYFEEGYAGGGDALLKLITDGAVILFNQDDTNYEYGELTPTSLEIANASAPSITKNRYKDPKLLFNPFRKYKISAPYSSDGSEFFPELLFSEYPTTYNGHYFWFDTQATGYIGDNNFYTKIASVISIDTYINYKYEKIGLASAVNYIFPCGTNALDVFNSTMAQSFYQSKTASGITSGLAIAGGIGSIALGVAGTIGTLGMGAGAGAGLIVGGATAIAGGVASMVDTIKSTNAKVEDLKNTPDSVNVTGSNFVMDDCINEDANGLPYIVVNEVPTIVIEKANDFFYNYGYQVARDCYFNTELKYNNDVAHSVDNNLLGRTIFNYVKLNEDITNKINAEIPQVIKQKLSQVFNKGITLWSFFGCDALWNDNNLTALNDPDLWFMKHNLDNTEYQG